MPAYHIDEGGRPQTRFLLSPFPCVVPLPAIHTRPRGTITAAQSVLPRLRLLLLHLSHVRGMRRNVRSTIRTCTRDIPIDTYVTHSTKKQEKKTKKSSARTSTLEPCRNERVSYKHIKQAQYNALRTHTGGLRSAACPIPCHENPRSGNL